MLPTGVDVDTVTLSRSNVPMMPRDLEANGLIVRRGHHDYDTWRVDSLQWSAEKDTYASLGLAILSVMLHERPECRVLLTHPRSEIKTLVVRSDHALVHDQRTGVLLTPKEYRYEMFEVARHPWIEDGVPPEDLPWFKLTNSDDMIVTEEQRSARDVIHGFGSLVGSSRFAHLLLDVGQRGSRTVEVALEGEAGFRGVAPASCEVRLWLPGGDYWEDLGDERAG
jgi:hypothetical protein